MAESCTHTWLPWKCTPADHDEVSGVAVNSALTGHSALLAYIPLVLELCVMSMGDESLPGLANTVGSDPFDTVAVQGVDIRFSRVTVWQS